jgi:hypothetical protein
MRRCAATKEHAMKLSYSGARAAVQHHGNQIANRSVFANDTTQGSKQKMKADREFAVAGMQDGAYHSNCALQQSCSGAVKSIGRSPWPN